MDGVKYSHDGRGQIQPRWTRSNTATPSGQVGHEKRVVEDKVKSERGAERKEVIPPLSLRWTPKVGQGGSLTETTNNDPNVQETTSAQS